MVENFPIPKKVHKLGEDILPSQLKYHNKRVAVTKEFTFDAAHHLHLYEGKCKSLHGHTYKLVITISGYLNDIGICIDFGEIKRLFKECIEAKLDHRYLNEVLPPMNTSAENMIYWMWQELEKALQELQDQVKGIRLEELKLYETPTSSVTLKREWVYEK
jgi:6-pyruvoyltetrahydropterin/6-carboxytetrahydropterin synthase